MTSEGSIHTKTVLRAKEERSLFLADVIDARGLAAASEELTVQLDKWRKPCHCTILRPSTTILNLAGVYVVPSKVSST